MLRKRFQETLHIADEDMIVPRHGELYVAIGAALSAMHDKPMDLDSWLSRMEEEKDVRLGTSKTLPPLLGRGGLRGIQGAAQSFPRAAGRYFCGHKS